MQMTTLTTAMKRLGTVIVAAVIAVAGLAMPNSPWEGHTTPEAQAQTSRNWGKNENAFNQCSFRRGTGDVALYAQQLCWIDFLPSLSFGDSFCKTVKPHRKPKTMATARTTHRTS
mgnify:CR=1 FL=1